MKKYLALALIAPLLISCSTTKKGDTYNEAWVKDTNGFDILMGQFAHNIENIWGFKEVVIAGPKDYVKYTDQYQTRSHINFDDGTITIETIAGTEPAAHLRRAIIKTLLMGDDPSSVDLYSDVDDITIFERTFPLRSGGGQHRAADSLGGRAATSRIIAEKPSAKPQ